MLLKSRLPFFSISYLLLLVLLPLLFCYTPMKMDSGSESWISKSWPVWPCVISSLEYCYTFTIYISIVSERDRTSLLETESDQWRGKFRLLQVRAIRLISVTWNLVSFLRQLWRFRVASATVMTRNEMMILMIVRRGIMMIIDTIIIVFIIRTSPAIMIIIID